MSVTHELAPVDKSMQWVSNKELVTSVGIRPAVMLKLSNEDVQHLLAYAGSMEDISKWLLSDLLVWGEGRIKRKLGTDTGKEFWVERDALWDIILSHYKSEVSKDTRYNMAGCARRWTYKRRRHTGILSFEHHRILVPLCDDEQEHWLELAEAGQWSVAVLRAKLYSKADPLEPPKVQVYTPLWTESRIREEIGNYTIRSGEMRGYLLDDDAVYLSMLIAQEYEAERERGK